MREFRNRVIEKTACPQDSLLNSLLESADYVDSFCMRIRDWDNCITLEDVAEVFASPLPKSVALLLKIRDALVAPFGLKKAADFVTEQGAFPSRAESGETLGFFRVYERSSHELVLGQDDRHLNFRISLHWNSDALGETVVVLTTLVFFNNRLGRAYFAVIRPFHVWIVPILLGKEWMALEQKATKYRKVNGNE